VRGKVVVMLAVILVVSSQPWEMVRAATVPPGFAPGTTTRVSVNTAGMPVGLSSTYAISANGRYVVFANSSSNVVPGVSGLQVYRRDRGTGVTELVSFDRDGHGTTAGAFGPAVSATGRYVVYVSSDANIVAGDTNGTLDVFVRDMDTGATSVASSSGVGDVGDHGGSLTVRIGANPISDDGRYVVFGSTSTNLAPGPINSVGHIYRKDLLSGDVVRVSVDNAGNPGDDASSSAVISGDGRVVAFVSLSANFSSLHTNHSGQVYIRDLNVGLTTLAAVTSDGVPATSFASQAPTLSLDGRYVAFETQAVLDPRDHDSFTWDVYLRDRVAGTTKLASLSANTFTFADSRGPSISEDGRYVGFHSIDSTLVPADVNNLTDVFLYDRDTEAITLVSLNDAGQQITGASAAFPSLSADGNLVLFGSAATNLVTNPASSGVQLYVRAFTTNVSPTVSLPGTAVVTAGDELVLNGSFTDPDAGQTWSATVDYGEGAGPASLTLNPDKAFTLGHRYLRPGSYTVSVVVTDSAAATGSATLAVTVKRRPLVFVPGMFGSELGVNSSGTAHGIPDGRGGTRDIDYPGCGILFSNPAIWLNVCEAVKPGTDDFFDVLKFDQAGQPLIEAIHPNGAMVKSPFAGLDPNFRTGYEDIEAFFEDPAHDGYVLGDDFVIFAYDWRQHVDGAVADLNSTVAAIRARTGASRVDIIAHSQGGLVVKQFLLTASERTHVDQVVFLGAPLLGTPLLTYGLLGGTCLPVFSSGLFCVIDPNEVADVARTLPSTTDLAPSPGFYDLASFLGLPAPYVDRRTNLPEAPPNNDYNAFVARAHEAGIPDHYLVESRALHADDVSIASGSSSTATAPWLASIPLSVNLSLVAGTGLATPGQVIERLNVQFFDLIDPSTGAKIGITIHVAQTAEFTAVDGDLDVVTPSASLNFAARPANVRAFYASGKTHAQLTLREGLPITLALLRGQDPVSASLVAAQPGPPTGILVDVHSPVHVIASDGQGRRLGFDGSNAIGEIPVAALNRIGDAEFLTLPYGSTYTVQLRGYALGDSLLRVRALDGSTARQYVFAHVPVRTTSVGSLTISGTGLPTSLALDLDGDGSVDRTIPAVALSGSAAADFTPPIISTIAPSGRATVGVVNVDWSASDADSGVLQSFGMVDRTISGGGTMLDVPGPVALSPGTHIIEVFAEDRAGNAAVRAATLTTYAYQFLQPLVNGRQQAAGGRTLPVRFVLNRPDGTPVEDTSVTVTLLDGAGTVVAGPLLFSTTPHDGVVYRDTTGYHGDLSAAGVSAGSYVLRVRFDSPTLIGDLLLGVDLS
jgi:Tol biopolymer transport system component/pimeloyl-ACP methyl ester carboxylesterase